SCRRVRGTSLISFRGFGLAPRQRKVIQGFDSMSAAGGSANTKIGVLGASGYTGAELVRLLLCHPNAQIVLLTAERRAGKTMAEVFAQFAPFALATLSAVEDADWGKLGLDVAFCALP